MLAVLAVLVVGVAVPCDTGRGSAHLTQGLNPLDPLAFREDSLPPPWGGFSLHPHPPADPTPDGFSPP